MDAKLAKTNFDYLNETFALKKRLEVNFLALGERLHCILVNRMFEPNYTDFDEFLLELGVGRATASKLINIYVRFILEWKFKPKVLAPVGWTKLAELLPIVASRGEAVEWLLKAEKLTKADLRRELTEEKTGIDMAKCKHKDSFLIRICNICGDRIREYEDNAKKK